MMVDFGGYHVYHTGCRTIFATAFGRKSAPVLLALGGWIGSLEDWVETISILSETWRVIAHDHRGSGITIAPPETITFDTLVDDVFAVLDAYGVEKCVLAAMSMGVAVALGASLLGARSHLKNENEVF